MLEFDFKMRQEDPEEILAATYGGVVWLEFDKKRRGSRRDPEAVFHAELLLFLKLKGLKIW